MLARGWRKGNNPWLRRGLLFYDDHAFANADRCNHPDDEGLHNGKAHSMSNGGRIRAFTMAELLALLCCGTVAIALIIPLIGSAKANDHVAITLNNLKNMNAALASYASDFNGRQLTPVADDISSYIGVSMQQVLAAYQSVN